MTNEELSLLLLQNEKLSFIYYEMKSYKETYCFSDELFETALNFIIYCYKNNIIMPKEISISYSICNSYSFYYGKMIVIEILKDCTINFRKFGSDRIIDKCGYDYEKFLDKNKQWLQDTFGKDHD